jgi:CRP/FNR family transcriptional regulator, cyclic AMP receptor protein
MSDKKTIFVVAEGDQGKLSKVVDLIKSNIDGAVVYSASEGNEALAKVQNTPPALLITGLELGRKMSGEELCQKILRDKSFTDLPILVLNDIPEFPDFADDRANGRMKFLGSPFDKDTFLNAVKNLIKVDTIKSNNFGVLKLSPGDLLFKQGEIADCAFLLKSGKLKASRKDGDKVIALGEVLAGEFVGEMAYITGEPRIADVACVEAAELIEIPLGTLDLLVFSKPTWTKALMKTLCRRLREANLGKS